MIRSSRGDTLAFVAREFGGAELGDERRRKRLVRVVLDLLEDPSRSIPKASGTWAGAKGAYRFFSNPHVTRESVMKAHWDQTVERIQTRDSVLVVEDTTFLNFTHHPGTQGLGKIGNRNAQNQLRGVLVHSALAVELGTHRVLGLIDQEVIIREDYQPEEESRAQRQERPRESQKWMTCARRAIQRVGKAEGLIFTFDREGDVFEVIQELRELGGRYVIRAAWNRRTEGPEGEEAHLLDQIRGEPILGEWTVELPASPGKKAQSVSLELRAASFRIVPPRRCGRSEPVEVRVVCARQGGPTGEDRPLEWILLTSEEIGTVQNVEAVIRHYTGRWKIEEWHKALKTGCRIEERELEDWDRLDVLLGVLSIVAWRLLILRDAVRFGDASVDDYLSKSEQAVLRGMDPKLPKGASLRDYLRSIAKLGGFLARKRDGDPGWITLWQGFARLRDLDRGFRLAQDQGCG
jgi:hypothetical protein